MPIKKIISGGQTGVDRAALDFAIRLGIPHGGWCPKGRLAEDGVISSRYQLCETESTDYSERTKLNLIESDATLVLVNALPLTVTDGTILTINELQRLNKPHLVLSLAEFDDSCECAVSWFLANKIELLNIAGPRESQAPGIYAKSSAFLDRLNTHYLEHTSSLFASTTHSK